MAHCTVFPKREIVGFEPPRTPNYQFPTVSLRTALAHVYETDAHVVPYSIHKRKRGLRINKLGLDELRGRGDTVLVGSVWYDVDCPDDDRPHIDYWWEGQLDRVNALPWSDTCGWYRTRGGYRLIWELASPLPPEQYEEFHTLFSAQLAGHGIDTDPACKDWTRFYRLPFVEREGESQEHDADWTRLGTLSWSPSPAELDAARSLRRVTGQPESGVRGLVGFFGGLGLYVRPYSTNKHIVVCPWADQHTKGRPGDSSTVLLAAKDGESHTFHCSHAHCSRRGRSDLRSLNTALWSSFVEQRAPERSEHGGTLTDRPQHTLKDVRGSLNAAVGEAAERDGATVIRAPLGAGKTETSLRMAITMAGRGKTVWVASPTRELRDETRLRGQNLGASDHLVQHLLAPGREPGHCDFPDHAEAIHRFCGPEYVRKQWCPGCPEYLQCGFYRSIVRLGSNHHRGRVVYLTHAMLSYGFHHLPDPDLIIIDESPLDTWMQTIELTYEQISKAVESGSMTISEAALDRIRSTLENSRLGRLDVVAAFDGVVTVKAPKDLPESAWKDSNGGISLSVRRTAELLEAYPDWRIFEALDFGQKNHWRGAYIYRGRLYLALNRFRATDLPSQRILYIDGTTTERIARVLLPGCTYVDLGEVVVDAHVNVVQVPWSGSRARIEERPVVAAALHRQFDSPDTLHVTHKRLLADTSRLGDHNWIDEVEGRVDYFGSPRSKGTNLYADCTRIVIEGWFVPGATVRSLAELLDLYGREAVGQAVVLADSDDLTTLEQWVAEARWHKELREIQQWIGRLRMSLRPDARLEIVYLDKRVLAPPTEVLDPGVLVYRETGEVRGRSAWLEFLRFQAQHLEHLVFGGSEQGCRENRKRVPLTDFETGVFSGLEDALKRYWGRNLEVMAHEAGLHYSRIRVARNGRIEQCEIVGRTPSPLAYAESVATDGGPCDWWTVNGSRYYTSTNRLYVTALELLRAGSEVTTATVAARMGVSPSLVWRSLRSRNITAQAAWARPALLEATPVPRHAFVPSRQPITRTERKEKLCVTRERLKATSTAIGFTSLSTESRAPPSFG